MYDPEHLKILRKGVATWNAWRRTHPDVRPNLNEADLRNKRSLIGINFQDTNLAGAQLRGMKLWDADFQGAYLYATDFRESELFRANFAKATARGTLFQKAFFAGGNLCGAEIRWADFSNTDVTGVQFDDEMDCLGASVIESKGSQRFVRHVMDLAYIEEFKANHPNWYLGWQLTSKCGRSWGRFALWCAVIILFFGVILFHFEHMKHPFFASIFAFSSFGFIDSSGREFWELFILALESLIGFVMFGCLVSLVATRMARRN